MSVVRYAGPPVAGGIVSNYLSNPRPYNEAFRSMANYARRRVSNYMQTRSGRRYTRTSNNRRNMRGQRSFRTGGGGVTTQHDRTQVYRKKSMPFRKKKGWRRFKRKVQAVAEKSLGSRTIVLNNLVTTSLADTTTNGTQLLEQYALYPVKNTSFGHLNDLRNIYANYTGDPGYNITDRLIFQSAVLDITIANGSIDSASVPVSIELDIYEVSSNSSWQDNSDASSANINLVNIIGRGFTDTANEGSAVTGLTLSQRGVTPFEACSALSSYKIKIWKKTKYFLGANQTMTYQFRDPKRHTWANTTIGQWESGNYPGVTRWVLAIAKATPGLNMDGTGRVRLYAGTTRKYLYKINKSSNDADALL
ncbi:MAG: putative capsid protein [Circoviridae sp.]|nr:MAG: putative capsid protein [Circoviridae sp.]